MSREFRIVFFRIWIPAGNFKPTIFNLQIFAGRSATVKQNRFFGTSHSVFSALHLEHEAEIPKWNRNRTDVGTAAWFLWNGEDYLNRGTTINSGDCCLYKSCAGITEHRSIECGDFFDSRSVRWKIGRHRKEVQSESVAIRREPDARPSGFLFVLVFVAIAIEGDQIYRGHSSVPLLAAWMRPLDWADLNIATS